ncbi:MAG: hypothetical protein ACRYFK_00835 [Janthinobacterium lividum]
MATSPQPAHGNNGDNVPADDKRAAATLTVDEQADNSNARTATEKESDDFLNTQTNGQTYDENESGQAGPDEMDDSLRSDYQAPVGSAPASADNLPDQLTHPSEANFTLPEMQHQGKTLTAEGDDK